MACANECGERAMMRGRQKSRATSALGQKQTFALQNAMSALPQKADIESVGQNVC
jgi:hypothetical protein